jgi:hypothetical protein
MVTEPSATAPEERGETPPIIQARRPIHVPPLADPRFVLVCSAPTGSRLPPISQRARPRRRPFP